MKRRRVSEDENHLISKSQMRMFSTWLQGLRYWCQVHGKHSQIIDKTTGSTRDVSSSVLNSLKEITQTLSKLTKIPMTSRRLYLKNLLNWDLLGTMLSKLDSYNKCCEPEAHEEECRTNQCPLFLLSSENFVQSIRLTEDKVMVEQKLGIASTDVSAEKGTLVEILDKIQTAQCPWWFIWLTHIASKHGIRISVFLSSMFPNIATIRDWWWNVIDDKMTRFHGICPHNIHRIILGITVVPFAVFPLSQKTTSIKGQETKEIQLAVVEQSDQDEEEESPWTRDAEPLPDEVDELVLRKRKLVGEESPTKESPECAQPDWEIRRQVRQFYLSDELNELTLSTRLWLKNLLLDPSLHNWFAIVTKSIQEADADFCTYVSASHLKVTVAVLYEKCKAINGWLKAVIGTLCEIFWNQEIFLSHLRGIFALQVPASLKLRILQDPHLLADPTFIEPHQVVVQLEHIATAEATVRSFLRHMLSLFDKWDAVPKTKCSVCIREWTRSKSRLSPIIKQFHMAHSAPFVLIKGHAGTGKTTFEKDIVTSHLTDGKSGVLVLCQYNKPLANLSGFITQTLTEQVLSVPLLCRTFSSFLMESSAQFWKAMQNVGVIIIEEASVMGLQMLAMFIVRILTVWSLDKLPRFLFVGDHYQLLPVNDVDVFSSMLTLCSRAVITLDKIHRQSQDKKSFSLRNCIRNLAEYGSELWKHHLQISQIGDKYTQKVFPPQSLINLSQLAGPGLRVLPKTILTGIHHRKSTLGDPGIIISKHTPPVHICPLDKGEEVRSMEYFVPYACRSSAVVDCSLRNCYLKKHWVRETTSPWIDSWSMIVCYTNRLSRRINLFLQENDQDAENVRLISRANLRDPNDKQRVVVANGQLGLASVQEYVDALKRQKELDAKTGLSFASQQKLTNSRRKADSSAPTVLFRFRDQEHKVPVKCLDLADAITNHSSQGSGFQVTAVCPDVAGSDARWLYVAITRAVEHVDYFCDQQMHCTLLNNAFRWFMTTICRNLDYDILVPV